MLLSQPRLIKETAVFADLRRCFAMPANGDCLVPAQCLRSRRQAAKKKQGVIASPQPLSGLCTEETQALSLEPKRLWQSRLSGL